MDEALPFPIGTLLDGRYRLNAVLGQGGMGAVYRAEQVSLQREVALKVLRTDLAGQEAAARFAREALALSKLDHPNIVRVIDSGQAEGRPYLVMELVSGRDLLQELFRGPMAPDRAVPILAQLCDALAAAHAHSIIHRDLKPENVIITETGVPKILDFGIAVADGGLRVTAAGFVLGTPEYLAPEQALGQALTARSDLYTLGVVAYRMLSGVLPFTATEPREYLLLHAGTQCPDLREKWADGKEWPELCDAVMKALNKDPWLRYPDALAMKKALEDALQHKVQAPGTATKVVAAIEAPRTATSALAVKTQNVAVLFAEISGWSERSAQLPPHAASLLQSKFEALLTPIAKRAGGRKVKTMGGTIIYAVPGPTAAVQAGMAMQDRLWADDRRLWAMDVGGSHDRLGAHIAISLGEVTVQEGDLFGEPVNIAARVMEHSAPDEVAFTDAVYLSMNRSDFIADELGPQQLKGIPHAVRIYKVRRASVPDLPPYGTRAAGPSDVVLKLLGALEKRVGGSRNLAIGAAALGALVVLGLVLALRHPAPAQVAQPEPTIEAVEQAEKALARNKPKEAQALLAPLLDKQPVPSKALAVSGRANIALGEWLAGLDQLHEAADADPGLRGELVNACVQGLGQTSKKKGCPVREKAILLLTAAKATEARTELGRIATSTECAHTLAEQALSAIGTAGN